MHFKAWLASHWPERRSSSSSSLDKLYLIPTSAIKQAAQSADLLSDRVLLLPSAVLLRVQKPQEKCPDYAPRPHRTINGKFEALTFCRDVIAPLLSL